MIERRQFYIGGRWVAPSSAETIAVTDSNTGAPYATIAAGTAADADAAVAAARAAFEGWSQTPPAQRADCVQRIADGLKARTEELARTISTEVGMPLKLSTLVQVGGPVAAWANYAKLAREFEFDHRVGHSVVAREPVGVVAAITPWNYPLNQITLKVAPALAAGCTVVVKPAETTPFTALLLADLLTRAGLPAGACNVVTGTGPAAGAPLVAHPQVDHVTFTGSVASGIGVMQAAAPQVTRVLLELGGKSPLVVMADCDFEQALDGAFGAIFENAGQICSAGSRLLIERPLHARFVEALVRRAQALALAHGLRDAGMGPVNSAAQQARIDGHVSRARDRGVTVLCGGHPCADPLTGQGWFYPPTVLDQVPSDDEAVRQEIFGPVLCVQAFDDADEALALANGTDFALVAGVYTRDFALAHRMARDIDAGQVYINEYFAGGIEVPFGGNRQSGFGREKGLEGLRSYCRTKSVAARL